MKFFPTLTSIVLGLSTFVFASSAKQYSYFDMKKLSEGLVDGTAPADTVLIDVREPSEYALGFIPGAHNMPLKSQGFALCKSPEEFESLLGFPKPSVDQHVVFYCQTGVRARVAEQQGEHCGYENRGIYLGSWKEWSELEAEVGQCA
ncbi:putative thiosulfate sulfurtransferase [Yarrowia sp. B02]|nr:putative thiosulfate sulfurtransferase [Yarrowia sp. B02]